MHVSPATAVAKELQAGEMPACVSVDVSVLAVAEAVLLTAVVEMFAPMPEPEWTCSLLDPEPMQ